MQASICRLVLIAAVYVVAAACAGKCVHVLMCTNIVHAVQRDEKTTIPNPNMLQLVPSSCYQKIQPLLWRKLLETPPSIFIALCLKRYYTMFIESGYNFRFRESLRESTRASFAFPENIMIWNKSIVTNSYFSNHSEERRVHRLFFYSPK